jgi:TusA-related sulfurtransferase
MGPLNVDECIEVFTDNEESSFKSIPNVCQHRKWLFIVLEDEDNKDIWRVRIQK